jgi:hypothetical protein
VAKAWWKPAANLVRTPKGLAQPGLKVRGREYLRIIYGPDYTEPENFARLKDRNLGHKRSKALREYALGLEALDRVALREPLWAHSRMRLRGARAGIGARRPAALGEAHRGQRAVDHRRA